MWAKQVTIGDGFVVDICSGFGDGPLIGIKVSEDAPDLLERNIVPLQKLVRWFSANYKEMCTAFAAADLGAEYIIKNPDYSEDDRRDVLTALVKSEFSTDKVKSDAARLLDGMQARQDRARKAKRVRRELGCVRAVTLRSLAERDGYACQKCGTTKDLHIDHIVPVARGGTNDLSNLQFLCRSCNSAKGASNGDQV
jgi:hypothetical protein